MSAVKSRDKIISFVCKAIIFLSAIIGTIVSAGAGRSSFMGGGSVFMYFTIQSNILMAIVSVIGACMLVKKIDSKIWNIIWFVSTVAITLTGFVFCFVLAPTMGGKAWNVQNILTHVIVPLLSIADFIYTGRYVHIDMKYVIWVIIPPLMYAIYAGIGYVNKWEFAKNTYYPYFFLNWGSEAGAFGFSNKLPFMGCGWWIIALLIFLILVGCLYLAIVNRLNKKLNKG